MKIKICGLRMPDEISDVNRLKPDYVGFVFAPSKRQVSLLMAIRMKVRLHPSIQTVGVFVNEPLKHVTALCSQGIIDLVQLHGDEDQSYMEELKARVDQPIIRAVRVREPEQIKQASRLPCDYLLLDPYVEGCYGGSGRRLSQELIPPEVEKPYFLAGGLTPENVREAAAGCFPYAVDVSSGVETNGRKDYEKMRQFIEAVRIDKGER